MSVLCSILKASFLPQKGRFKPIERPYIEALFHIINNIHKSERE